ncbi:Pollen coat-like protein [Arachis hypogaea]|nr:Pollen coat-like protein [Arachis hypogaea]
MDQNQNMNPGQAIGQAQGNMMDKACCNAGQACNADQPCKETCEDKAKPQECADACKNTVGAHK